MMMKVIDDSEQEKSSENSGLNLSVSLFACSTMSFISMPVMYSSPRPVEPFNNRHTVDLCVVAVERLGRSQMRITF